MTGIQTVLCHPPQVVILRRFKRPVLRIFRCSRPSASSSPVRPPVFGWTIRRRWRLWGARRSRRYDRRQGKWPEAVGKQVPLSQRNAPRFRRGSIWSQGNHVHIHKCGPSSRLLEDILHWKEFKFHPLQLSRQRLGCNSGEAQQYRR